MTEAIFALVAAPLPAIASSMRAPAAIDLDRVGTQQLGDHDGRDRRSASPIMPALMEQLVRFRPHAALAEEATASLFDAMHAVTGPYARRDLSRSVWAPPESSMLNFVPKPDFGNHHPDPNPAHAEELMARMWAADAPALGAASDGDGDRNMILGPKACR